MQIYSEKAFHDTDTSIWQRLGALERREGTPLIAYSKKRNCVAGLLLFDFHGELQIIYWRPRP